MILIFYFKWKKIFTESLARVQLPLAVGSHLFLPLPKIIPEIRINPGKLLIFLVIKHPGIVQLVKLCLDGSSLI